MDLAEAYRNKKVLITGGLGFLGSNLAHRLVELGAEVLLADAMLPEFGGNLANIADIKDKVQVNFSDIRDSHSLVNLVKTKDYIFSLAGTHNSQDCLYNPLYDLDIVCRGHLTLLEACRQQDTGARILFAAGRHQYGRKQQAAVNEEHPLRPLSPNGLHNALAEAYYLLYNTIHGLPTTVLRLTDTYGPRHLMKHHKLGVVNWFVKLILENREIYVFGDGSQIRDIVYVSDVVEAMLIAAASPQAQGQVYNIGGAPISILELVKLLIQITGKGGYKLMPYPDIYKLMDVGDYIADYTKIREALGWEPKISLEEGLNLTFQFYEARKGYYW